MMRTFAEQKRGAGLRAFSLLEVMVAGSLLAIVGALLFASLSTSITAKEVAEVSSNRYHQSRQALSRMTDEISMAYMSGHVNLSELQTKTGFKGERDRMDFTAFGNVPRVQDSKQSEQRELSYIFDTDERTNTKAILRREQANPDLEIDEGGRTRTLLSGVKEVEFLYFDDVSADWKEKWDTENSATLNRLPSRVKIKFTAIVDDIETERVFVTESKIALTTPFKFN